MNTVFERFSDRSRRVLVLAQEEARRLGSGHIGTEHLLLGLLSIGDGIAYTALDGFGVTLAKARERVQASPEADTTETFGSPPFTPETKRALEMALREALGLGNGSIDSGHLLLGLLQVSDSLGVRVMQGLGVDLGRLRETVVTALTDTLEEQGVGERGQDVLMRRAPVRVMHTPMPGMGQGKLCSFCQRDLWEVPHYVSAGLVSICAQCIGDAQRIITDAGLEDHQLSLPPRVFGEEPDSAALEAVIRAITDPPSRENLEDFDELEPYLLEAGRRHPGVSASTRVLRVRFLSPTLAEVQFEIYLGGPGGFPFTHRVRKDGQRWLRRRDDQAELLRRGGVAVPPRGSHE